MPFALRFFTISKIAVIIYNSSFSYTEGGVLWHPYFTKNQQKESFYEKNYIFYIFSYNFYH